MIVVDVETTGQIPGRHMLVSIGALEFERPDNQFYGECRIDKDTEINPVALEVNGLTEKQIKDSSKPSLRELITKFDAWMTKIPNKTMGGHNTGFDINMLWAAYHRAGLHAPFGYRHLDIHSLAYASMLKRGQQIPTAKSRSAVDSDVIAVYVGLPTEPKPHQALPGAKHEAEVLSRLIFGANLLAEFKQYPIPDFLLPPA